MNLIYSQKDRLRLSPEESRVLDEVMYSTDISKNLDIKNGDKVVTKITKTSVSCVRVCRKAGECSWNCESWLGKYYVLRVWDVVKYRMVEVSKLNKFLELEPGVGFELVNHKDFDLKFPSLDLVMTMVGQLGLEAWEVHEIPAADGDFWKSKVMKQSNLVKMFFAYKLKLELEERRLRLRWDNFVNETPESVLVKRYEGTYLDLIVTARREKPNEEKLTVYVDLDVEVLLKFQEEKSLIKVALVFDKYISVGGNLLGKKMKKDAEHWFDIPQNLFLQLEGVTNWVQLESDMSGLCFRLADDVQLLGDALDNRRKELSFK